MTKIGCPLYLREENFSIDNNYTKLRLKQRVQSGKNMFFEIKTSIHLFRRDQHDGAKTSLIGDSGMTNMMEPNKPHRRFRRDQLDGTKQASPAIQALPT